MTEVDAERTAVRAAIHGAWAGVAAAWGAHADALDARTGAITQRLLDLADLRDGDSVLELAGGPGAVGIAAAARVGRRGSVLISDVVPAMVEVARRRVAERGLGNVTTTELDLENIAQPDATFDSVLCREGLMFALDPAHAVREIHRILRPRGTVAVAVWADKSANPWLGLLLDEITDVTGIPVPPPGIPGPFALGDPQRLHALFADAGFTDLRVDAVPAPVRAPSFEAWWARTRQVAGPAVAILNAVDDATRQRIEDGLRASTATFQSPDGQLRLPGLAVVIGGRRP